MHGRKELEWKGDDLHIWGSKGVQISIVRDTKYSNMWRVKLFDGTLTDMVNRTRAKDAAELILLKKLNG